MEEKCVAFFVGTGVPDGPQNLYKLSGRSKPLPYNLQIISLVVRQNQHYVS